MSYYTELDNDLGSAEEAERHCRDYEFEQSRKRANQRSLIAREVKKQLKSIGVKKQFNTATMVDVECKCCKVNFQARKADIKRGWGKFCSKSCKAKKQKYNGYLHR